MKLMGFLLILALLAAATNAAVFASAPNGLEVLTVLFALLAMWRWFAVTARRE